MSHHPNCPVCDATVAHLHIEQYIHTYTDPHAFDMRVPGPPNGYSFEPCGHRITDQQRVEAYTAAGRYDT